MTFAQIERGLLNDSLNFDKLGLKEKMTYLCLRSLYNDYAKQNVSVEHAGKEKLAIKNSYEQACKTEDFHVKLNKSLQNNLNKGIDLICEINKATANGTGEHELLLMALECISCMTGERTFYETNKELLERR